MKPFGFSLLLVACVGLASAGVARSPRAIGFALDAARSGVDLARSGSLLGLDAVQLGLDGTKAAATLGLDGIQTVANAGLGLGSATNTVAAGGARAAVKSADTLADLGISGVNSFTGIGGDLGRTGVDAFGQLADSVGFGGIASPVANLARSGIRFGESVVGAGTTATKGVKNAAVGATNGVIGAGKGAVDLGIGATQKAANAAFGAGRLGVRTAHNLGSSGVAVGRGATEIAAGAADLILDGLSGTSTTTTA